ncbi:hypothetical protein FGIG_05631 [Fasciola gigantica]|uniref:G-protein coupled receptors family 1 profile domain-containing protein n=1 Tax=Fasciola gigantica TaxID=46835 RepID=A0A504YB39_FASGI|nr:hypothetical protein FGIG_05631 [Fasciola gigantica]
MLSVWTVVILSMERFLLIIAPLRFYKFLRPKIAWITMGITSIIIGLINIPWIFSFDYVQKSACLPGSDANVNHVMCTANHIFKESLLAGFILLTILPAILVFTANTQIAKTLSGRRNRWKSKKYEDPEENTSHSQLSRTSSSSSSSVINTHNCPLYDGQIEAVRNERTLTIRLFLVSATFFILSTPSLIFVGFEAIIINSKNAKILKQTFDDAFHVSLFMFAINLTVNFVLYCLVGRLFRSAVIALICCDWANYRALRSQLIKGSNEDEKTRAHSNSRQHSMSNS